MSPTQVAGYLAVPLIGIGWQILYKLITKKQPPFFGRVIVVGLLLAVYGSHYGIGNMVPGIMAFGFLALMYFAFTFPRNT